MWFLITHTSIALQSLSQVFLPPSSLSLPPFQNDLSLILCNSWLLDAYYTVKLLVYFCACAGDSSLSGCKNDLIICLDCLERDLSDQILELRLMQGGYRVGFGFSWS